MRDSSHRPVIQYVESDQFLLLEKLVSDVPGMDNDHPGIHYSTVTVDKPHAFRFAGSVLRIEAKPPAFTITRRKQHEC